MDDDKRTEAFSSQTALGTAEKPLSPILSRKTAECEFPDNRQGNPRPKERLSPAEPNPSPFAERDGEPGVSPSPLVESLALAEDMLALARDSLLVSLSFANRPAAALPMRVSAGRKGCATDGAQAFFAPGFVLDAFKANRTLLAHAYLHMMLHCLLGHPFPGKDVDPLRWSVACDLSVACTMREIAHPAIELENAARDRRVDDWAAKAERRTADEFYAILSREGLSAEELADLELNVGIDSHELWTFAKKDGEGEESQDGGVDPAGLDERRNGESGGNSRETPNNGIAPSGSAPRSPSQSPSLSERWKKVARATEMDLARSHARGESRASALSTLLRNAGTESSVGLEEIVRAYAEPREETRMNPDEFDTAFYTYGLQEYGNVALVEPTEQTEGRTVRDFVIAIDTSGSVSGPPVRSFVRKTCGLLCSCGALDPESRVRIVQCDDAIRSEHIVSSEEEALSYAREIELKGFGGTDFRPVFEHVERLVEKGEIGEVAGLLYFTDGEGTFPEQAPGFDAAFVFLDRARPVPPWASSVVELSGELD